VLGAPGYWPCASPPIPVFIGISIVGGAAGFDALAGRLAFLAFLALRGADFRAAFFFPLLFFARDDRAAARFTDFFAFDFLDLDFFALRFFALAMSHSV
jgi:hypothetical protein